MRGDELTTSDYMCVLTVFFVFVCGIKLQPQVAFLKANHCLSLESVGLSDKPNLHKKVLAAFGLVFRLLLEEYGAVEVCWVLG